MIKQKEQSIATDSFILMFVKCITIAVGIIQAMILARILSKDLYGSFSEGLLIISFFSPLFSLGLDNAINFFFNKSNNLEEKKDYINTIVFLSLVAGVIGGGGLLIAQNGIAEYYNNPSITSFFIYIAFRPCLTNLISLYQPLYISSGYAKVIAIRNLLISIFQVLIVTLTSIFIHDLSTLFLLLLILDFIQLIFFANFYKKHDFSINPLKFKKEYFKLVLIYALPMMLANAVGTLSINMDNLVISNLMTVEDYALYTNMSKELPFSFIAASFTAVVTPKIVQLLNGNKMDELRSLWSDYLEIGYTVTWPLCVGALILAPKLIEILYSTKYLDSQGIVVFQIYTVVAMIRFTYFGMIPTASGETRIVFYYSLISLFINMCLNYILFYLMGMCGPPLATFISIFIMGIFYFRRSIKLINSSFIQVIRIKKVLVLIFEMILTGIVVITIDGYLNTIINNIIIQFVFSYLLFIGIIFAFKRKDLKRLIKSMNNQKRD